MRGVLLAIALAMAGCGIGHIPSLPHRVPACDGPLVSTDEIGPDFLARETYRVTYAKEGLRVDLVVQKHDGALTVVGFHPTGAKLFQIVQRGTEVSVRAMPEVVTGVPPENVLHDLHRARFGASDDAELEGGDTVVMITNARCGTRSWLKQISWQALP